jgi:hypothetical protein
MTVAFVGICVLALIAPFELLQPVMRLPGQTITNLEVALLVSGAVFGAAIVIRRDRQWLRQPTAAAWLGLLLAMGLAAAFAPADRANAIHMVGRYGMAFGVCLMAANGITNRGRLERVLALAIAGAAAAALLAILEYLGEPAVLRALHAFRPGISVVGAQIRATGPLQYPTIASMCFEIAFAFSLGLLAAAIDNGWRWRAVVAAGAALLLSEAIVLTFTRAGMITMATSGLLVFVARLRLNGRRDPVVAAVVAIGALVFVQVATSRSLDALRLRATTEEQNAWYRALITAPEDVALRTGEFATVPISLVNVGRLTWDSTGAQPFRVSYHWLLADEDRVVSYDGLRTPLPEGVAPGDRVALNVRVRAPQQPGRYRLMWDVVQERRLWFSTEPGALMVVSRAVIAGPPAGPVRAMKLTDLPRPPGRPGRLVLWRAAARMVEAHPLFGIGPDNFRLRYGGYGGVADADTRVHSNDMYVEMLAGGGLVGGAAFAWLVWAALGCFRAAARGGAYGPAAVGVAAAGLAIAVHGLVDSFLGFTPTYILLAMTVGLAAACRRSTESEAHAHRV